MCSEWEPVRLGDLIAINHGWPFKSEEFREDLTGKPIVVAVGNFWYDGGFRFDTTATKEYHGDYPKSYELTPGDTLLIMTCQTPGGEILGVPARIPDDGRVYLHNQRLGKVVVRDPDKVDPNFLYHLFRSRDFNQALCATASGSKILHTAPTRIEAYEFRCPPIDVQRDIASLLGSLDDKVEQNRRTGRALEELARATFKAWFVDFEPVKAKAAGATSFPGMPPAAFAALPDRLTGSPIGPVPRGWATPPFSELMTDSKERVGDRIVPAYSSTNDGVFPRDERFTKDLSKSQAKNLLIRRGDLVFGLSREILNFGVMHDEVGAVSPAYKVFRPCSPLLTARYVETMIRERVGYYRQIVKSSSREGQSVTADHFLRLAVLVPPPAIRETYAAFENATWQMIDHLQTESSKLAALRDYLLPRLLSGQVRVAHRRRR